MSRLGRWRGGGGRGAALVFEVLFGNGRPAEFAGALRETAQRGANGSSALAVRINVRSVQLRLTVRLRDAKVLLGGFVGLHVLVVDEVGVSVRGLACALRGGRGCGGDRCLVGEQADEICRALEMLAQEVRVGAGARDFADAGQGLYGGMGDGFDVGFVVSAGDSDPGSCRAAGGVGGGEFCVKGAEVGFGGLEFGAVPRGGCSKLGFTPRELADASVDLAECRKGRNGGAAGRVFFFDVGCEGVVGVGALRPRDERLPGGKGHLAEGNQSWGATNEMDVEV